MTDRPIIVQSRWKQLSAVRLGHMSGNNTKAFSRLSVKMNVHRRCCLTRWSLKPVSTSKPHETHCHDRACVSKAAGLLYPMTRFNDRNYKAGWRESTVLYIFHIVLCLVSVQMSNMQCIHDIYLHKRFDVRWRNEFDWYLTWWWNKIPNICYLPS